MQGIQKSLNADWMVEWWIKLCEEYKTTQKYIALQHKMIQDSVFAWMVVNDSNNKHFYVQQLQFTEGYLIIMLKMSMDHKMSKLNGLMC